MSSTTGFAAVGGDVNGDGYSDVVHGDYDYTHPEQFEGGVFLYYGNSGPGMSLKPRQLQSDGSGPIAPGGRSNAPGSFALSALGRTPFGRGGVRLEWEIKPLGSLFTGNSTLLSSSAADTGTAGVNLNEANAGWNPGAYHWRVRLRYDTAKTPFAQKSRWFTMPWNGWQEIDLTLGAFLGGWVWDDLDQDGVRDAGEPGHAGVLVSLLNFFGTVVDQKTTPGDGFYSFLLPGFAASFQLGYLAPSGTALTAQNQGADDTVDSDPDPVSGFTPLLGPAFTFVDGLRWSAGLACNPPTLPILITGARTLTGTTELILDFTDPNPFSQVTGYNVYRSSQPQPPPAPWIPYGTDVTDGDPNTPNIQWSDATGTNPGLGGVLYYQVTAFNHNCNAEGPR